MLVPMVACACLRAGGMMAPQTGLQANVKRAHWCCNTTISSSFALKGYVTHKQKLELLLHALLLGLCANVASPAPLPPDNKRCKLSVS